MRNKNRKRSAFTLVEIMIVVSIIGLIAAIAIPNYASARARTQKNSCLANLKQITNAKATWAMEQNKNTSDTPDTTDLFGAGAYITNEPKCPATGDSYSLNKVDQSPSCSILDHSLDL